MTSFPERVFSGMQPTHTLHLGNYLGAMVNWIAHAGDAFDCLYCVVDMHAITTFQEPKELLENIREVTAAYLACGLDPKRSIIFNQSQVAEHAELAWVFNCVAPLGWLNRMTQFKEKAGKDRENASIGLYAYPNLMAADILAYKGTHVPVGEDQKQHLELARDIAQKFNNDFAESIAEHGHRRRLLPAAGADDHRPGDAGDEPPRRHEEDVEVGCLGLFAHQPDRRCRHDRAKNQEGEDRSGTAPLGGEGPGGPAGGGEPRRHLCRARRSQQGGGAQRVRRRAVLDLQAGAGRARRAKARADRRRDATPAGRPGHIDAVLADGAERARAIAAPIMRDVKDVVGLLRPR